MPSETFNNLSEQKKKKIISALKDTFKNKTIFDANIKEVVEKSGIARGSFYQYFDDLEDAYFMILDMETTDIHRLFNKLLINNNYDVFETLNEYGLKVSTLIFEPENYSLYKNRYLYWNPNLETSWNSYRKKKDSSQEMLHLNNETMEFTKAVIHNLIKRAFLNNWSREEFIEHFDLYVNWLKRGVDYNEFG